MKTSANIQLRGHTPANRDAVVRMTHEATGKVVERKPFLDGSLLMRDLDPGNYELQVLHPNLVQPIEARRVRIFDQRLPTVLPVRVRPELFRDTPIRDVPDADLAPVQQTATSVADRIPTIAGKSPGEAIKAADWNTLVECVGDLTGAVLELTALVSPRGHDHPEIAEKIDEVQGNLRRFAESFGRSLLELRREIETLDLEQTVEDALAGADEVSPEVRDRFTRTVGELAGRIQGDTPQFTGKLANAGHTILSGINEVAQAQGDQADAYRAQPAVVKLTNAARRYVEAGSQVTAESELKTYQRTGTESGGQKLLPILRR